MEKFAGDFVERKENKCICHPGDRAAKRRLDTATKGHQTEIDVLWTCNESRGNGEGDDAGVRGGEEE